MEGGDIKYILIGLGACVQMAEVPSTALDMGNEEHHYGNWRAQNTSMRCLQGPAGRLTCDSVT